MLRIMTIAGALLLALPAAQAETVRPTLKSTATIAGDVVLIGDLVQHAGAQSDVAIFRSPDLGTTGAVAVERVREAVRPYGLSDLDTGGLTEVVVRRPSRAITVRQIESRIVEALSGQRGLGSTDDLSIGIDQSLRSIHVEAHATAELQVLQLNVDRYRSRFNIVLDIPGSAILRRTPLRLSGRVVVTSETAVLIRSMRRGDIIRRGDIVMKRRPRSEISKDGIGRPEYAVGLAVRRRLRAGHALRHADLMKPELVRRDDTVTLVYQLPGILLTARGKAAQAGAEGDAISVLNLQSKRTVNGTVIGPGQVAATGTVVDARPTRTASLKSAGTTKLTE